MKPQKGTPPKPLDGIGFRLDPDALQELSSRAQRLGISRHELARQYVIERMQDAETKAALQHAILLLHREIKELREDVSLSTRTLLVSAGKVEPEQAEKWAAENLPPG